MLHLIFDNIRKPPNVGAAVRIAVATGAHLIFTGSSLPHTHRKCRGAAVGYADKIDVKYYDQLRDCVLYLREQGMKTIGTSPYAKKPYWDLDLTQPMAIVFGNEATGLSREKLELMDEVVLIPMPGEAESLNLATSAAIIASESIRQRYFLNDFEIESMQGVPDRLGQ